MRVMSSAAGCSTLMASWLGSAAQPATGPNQNSSRDPGARTRQLDAGPSSSCWSGSRSAATNPAGPGTSGPHGKKVEEPPPKCSRIHPRCRRTGLAMGRRSDLAQDWSHYLLTTQLPIPTCRRPHSLHRGRRRGLALRIFWRAVGCSLVPGLHCALAEWPAALVTTAC